VQPIEIGRRHEIASAIETREVGIRIGVFRSGRCTALANITTVNQLIRRDVQCGAQAVEYHITQYDLEQGALEIQYIEEFFGEFARRKTAAEIVRRLSGRSHLILLANAPLPDDPGTVVPVSFKVAHRTEARRFSEPAASRGAVHRPARAL
jgi:hypothetical protein